LQVAFANELPFSVDQSWGPYIYIYLTPLLTGYAFWIIDYLQIIYSMYTDSLVYKHSFSLSVIVNPWIFSLVNPRGLEANMFYLAGIQIVSQRQFGFEPRMVPIEFRYRIG
jgi:hypothetical protein